jgi:hypothetical protein
MPRLSLIPVGLLLFGLRLYAAPVCVSGGSLASYEALAAGCTVGPFTVMSFTFGVVSSTGGPTLVTAADITVTPEIGVSGFGQFYGLQFASTGFQVTATQSVEYSLAYTVDPTPDIRGLGDVLDPPVGDVNIQSVGCVNAAFSGNVCPTSTVTINVSTASPNAFVDIAPPDTTLGIIDTIDLDEGGGTASGFDSIEGDSYVPEPAAGSLMAALGLALAAARIRIRKP